MCGKRYFTVTALKKHHAMHGEGGVGNAGGSGIGSSSNGGVISSSGVMVGIGSGGSSGLATMDNIEGNSKFSAKASTSDSAADRSTSDDETSAIDASILEIDGLTQVRK